MSFFSRILLLLLLVCAVISPIKLAAQREGGPGPKPGIPQTDQQRRGEALFMQNCPLCHVWSKQKQDVAVLSPTFLIGMFRGDKPALTEATARVFIVNGIPQKMPTFKYQLDSKQIDDIIEYLKIR
jgi:mono/diheme cytochrome c family protein